MSDEEIEVTALAVNVTIPDHLEDGSRSCRAGQVPSNRRRCDSLTALAVRKSQQRLVTRGASARPISREIRSKSSCFSSRVRNSGLIARELVQPTLDQVER